LKPTRFFIADNIDTAIALGNCQMDNTYFGYIAEGLSFISPYPASKAQPEHDHRACESANQQHAD
ncbi:MAG: hypothetical protein K6U74_18015, partial [Firmicutes bacterium]|nr:hypothetical protein [Bacillota bacterium]